jgi:hypothetical protein
LLDAPMEATLLNRKTLLPQRFEVALRATCKVKVWLLTESAVQTYAVQFEPTTTDCCGAYVNPPPVGVVTVVVWSAVPAHTTSPSPAATVTE